MNWLKLIGRRGWMGSDSLWGVGAAGAGVPEGAGWSLEAAAGGAGLGVGGEREAVGEDQRAGGRVVAVSRRVGAGSSRVGGGDEVLGGGEVCGCRAGRKVMAGGQRGADGGQAARQADLLQRGD